MSFEELEDVKNHLSSIRRNLVPSLRRYKQSEGLGFAHQLTTDSASLASTATCIAAIVACGEWSGFGLSAETVASTLISKKTSSELDDHNPFSIAFVAEGVMDLGEADPAYGKRAEHAKRIEDDHGPRLARYLTKEGGGSYGSDPGAIAISPYPSSAYLTQLVYRVVKRCGRATPALTSAVQDWSRGEINKQIALLSAGSRSGDVMQLLYALILAVDATPAGQATPEDQEIFAHALSVFFEKQDEDGSWPLSRPMFHYRKVGNAYCFDFEALTQLLLCLPLREDLLSYLPHLRKAARLLDRTAFHLGSDEGGSCVAWASGHHPQIKGPESWSTAAVYHFVQSFDRLVAEAVRRTLFSQLRAVYPGPPQRPSDNSDVEKFAPKFLDAEVRRRGEEPLSLRRTLAQRFVFPLAIEAVKVEQGGRIDDDVAMSAILFGPPGTSKTELAKLISEHLRWPLLQVDPSFLVQDGLDRVQAMANNLFSMLVAVEQIVVLLDEFDEVGRDRTGNANLLSRFITTAMLPKLAAINRERKIVFLLATNYVSGFDAAFRRGGRFDMVLQVMQPTLEAKLGFKAWAAVLSGALERLGERRAEVSAFIGDLTFLETKDLVRALDGVTDPEEIRRLVALAHKGCTLEKPNDVPLQEDENQSETAVEDVGSPREGYTDKRLNEETRPKTTWRTSSAREAKEMRLPPIPMAR